MNKIWRFFSKRDLVMKITPKRIYILKKNKNIWSGKISFWNENSEKLSADFCPSIKLIKIKEEYDS
jgi:hypothetical protein